MKVRYKLCNLTKTNTIDTMKQERATAGLLNTHTPSWNTAQPRLSPNPYQLESGNNYSSRRTVDWVKKITDIKIKTMITLEVIGT